MGISKNLAFDHLILYPSPKREGQTEFLEMPLIYLSTAFLDLLEGEFSGFNCVTSVE